MGFLRFLKREKKETLDELDLPPAPPPLGDFDKDITLPELPDIGEEIIPQELKFDFPEEERYVPSKERMPEFPKFFPIEEKPPAPMPPISAPSMLEPMPHEEEHSPVSTDTYPKISVKHIAHEKRISRERLIGEKIYIRIDRFKAALGNISVLRNDLKKSEEALMKLETVKNSKDKSFDKFKASLDDLQKKLIFIDKTLFKGE